MKAYALVLLLAGMTINMSSLEEGYAQSSAEQQLRALDAGWARSYEVHDTAFAKSLFADSIIITATNGSVKNKEGELRDVRAQPGLVMSFFRTREVVVRT